MVFADLDDDGRGDLVIAVDSFGDVDAAGWVGNLAVVYADLPDGTVGVADVASAWFTEGGGSTSLAAVGDVTGDGTPDLLAVGAIEAAGPAWLIPMRPF